MYFSICQVVVLWTPVNAENTVQNSYTNALCLYWAYSGVTYSIWPIWPKVFTQGRHQLKKCGVDTWRAQGLGAEPQRDPGAELRPLKLKTF